MSEELTKQILDIILGDPLVTAIVGVGLLALAMLIIFGKDIMKMKGIGPIIIVTSIIGGLAITLIVGSLFLDVFRAVAGI